MFEDTLDEVLMEASINLGAVFSINENELSVEMSIKSEKRVGSDDHFSYSTSLYKPARFTLGYNLFNFLAITAEDIRVVRELASSTNQRKEGTNDSVFYFFQELDCVYLYLIYYSGHRGSLGLDFRSRLDRLQKEFDFALNFCCNDGYIEDLKGLTCMQRYLAYSQLYVDNIYTISDYYKQSGSLFLDTESTVLDNVPRMQIETKLMENTRKGIYDAESSFDPVTALPQIPGSVSKELAQTKATPTFRYECEDLAQCLMEELFYLIKNDVKVKKCQNCNKYFISKGHYSTSYCDRVPDEGKYSCKRIAALRARKDKVRQNPILQEYERAYKRNYARRSNKKITPEAFTNWADEAAKMRDEAQAEYEKNPSKEVLDRFKQYLGNK